MKAVVVGSGGWGTALSMVLCDNGHDVTLWSHDPAKAAEMAKTRENSKLKGVRLPDSLKISGDLDCRMPTGCVSACPDLKVARLVQDAFMNDYFRVYTSEDIVGVELSAAMKNVVALACGVCDGMGYQDNTKALLMTRAMAELTRLGEKLGGTRQTFGGLAGMGDLIVTCTSMHSRNRRAGILLGQGKSVGQALAETGGVVEGYYAAASMHQLAEKTGVEMPICRCVYEILYRQRPVQEVARELMGRARKGEIEDGWRYPVG